LTASTTPSRSVIDVIRARCSWRTYDGRPIAADKRRTLEAILADPPAAPFGSRVRLALLDTNPDQQTQPLRLGTYGVIKGAPSFVAGAVRRGELALEDFGYVFQRVILLATELGLGTCWLGGTFKRDRFGQALAAAEDELVPAVSPVGHAHSRRSLVDSVFRWGAGSKKRRPWPELFFDRDLASPLSEKDAGPHATPLEMVRIGPSASNKQPWRLVRQTAGDGEVRFHLLLRRSPGYRGRFEVDLQRLDMGIAICHFELAARELGLPGAWRLASPPPRLGGLPADTSYVATWAESS
jgi:nitroreductase